MVKTGIKKVKVLGVILALLSSLFLLFLAVPASALEQNPSELVDENTELPDLVITAIKPYHYEWSEQYSIAKGDPWFNLVNYVNVTVKNNGTATAENFEMKLYAEDIPIGSKTVDKLSKGKDADLKFEWIPEGEDPLSWTDTAQGAKLAYTDTNKNYTLRAVIDEDEEVQELNESNNEFTQAQEVAWNGYMFDELLDVYEHDVINGGVIFTTGDGVYRSDETRDSGTVFGSPYTINYVLQIPGGTKLARFYIYYTWADPKGTAPKAPKIGVTLKTPSGSTADLGLETSYNDIKNVLNYKYHAWGTYAYDITNYVNGNGTYVVTIANLNDGSDGDFTDEYSFAAPALLVVYENISAPKREYWINEGADILMGGREIRPEGGFLGLEACRNSAEFSGPHWDLEVEKAVLGVVSPWADDADDDVIEFNGVELGSGLYNGYFDAWRKELPGLSMEVGADEAQQGVAAFDVLRHLEDDDNAVIQGDDGDNMMSANAFLVITYKEEDEEEEDAGRGSGGSSAKDTVTTAPTSTSAAPTATVTKASRTIPALEVGKEVGMIFQDMDVSLLTLKADTNVSDVKIVLERIKKPMEVTEPSGIPYIYLDMKVEHEEETATIGGRIEFKVAKSWISANNIDEATITLNRYYESEGWIALPTSRVGEENTFVYFEAATTDFSIFAITGEEKVGSSPESAPIAASIPSPAATPTATPASHDMEQNPEADGASVPGFKLALSVGMLIGGAYLLRIRKKNRRAN